MYSQRVKWSKSSGVIGRSYGYLSAELACRSPHSHMNASDLIHLSRTIEANDQRRLETTILEAESALGSDWVVGHLGKPWVVVVQSVGQRRVYLASRLGTTHHFVGRSLDELISVFRTWIAERSGSGSTGLPGRP